MQQPVARSPRLDAIDEERFADMVASESFALLKDRIAGELDRARTDCETQFGLTLTRAQGRVNALRTVLEIPAIMLREIKARK